MVICPAVIHIIAQGDRIHHGPYDEHLLAGPKDLVGDIPGCRAKIMPYPMKVSCRPWGPVSSKDVMEERSPIVLDRP
jgi:hypothetical protein